MATSTRPRRSRQAIALENLIQAALEDMKALDVRVLDVRGLTDIADTMIIASGTSDRHVRSIAERVVERARTADVRPLGVEGQREADWVLVDFNDTVVHVMLPRVRELYGLERLWEAPQALAAAASRRPRRRLRE